MNYKRILAIFLVWVLLFQGIPVETLQNVYAKEVNIFREVADVIDEAADETAEETVNETLEEVEEDASEAIGESDEFPEDTNDGMDEACEVVVLAAPVMSGDYQSLDWFKANKYDADIVDDGASIQSVVLRTNNDLVLFSQLEPELYENATINLNDTGAISSFILTNEASGKNDGQTYTTQQLGSEEHPFSGALIFSGDFHTEKAIFAYLGSATISPITVVRDVDSVASPILTEVYSGTDGNYTVTINQGRDPETGAATNYSYSGVMGEMADNSSVSLRVVNKTSAKIIGSDDAGYYCNRMGENASLTVSSAEKFVSSNQIVALNGDAGGFVGHMASGAGLTIAESALFQGSVEAQNDCGGIVGEMEENATLNISGSIEITGTLMTGTGNGGGVVGTVNDAYINIENVTKISAVKISGSDGSDFGGIVGHYICDENGNPTWIADGTHIIVNNINMVGGKNVGGLFGVFENRVEDKVVTIEGTGNVSSYISADATNYGGLIGKYTAKSLQATLHIGGTSTQDLQITSGKENYQIDNQGGLIALVSGDAGAAYIEVEDVKVITNRTAGYKAANKTVNTYGGLVARLDTKGHFLNIKNVTIEAKNKYQGTHYAGGLIGYSDCGVVRVSGITDLTLCAPANTSKTAAGNGVDSGGSGSKKAEPLDSFYGQLVGYRDNTLVYALGSGNASDAGWEFKRYSYSINKDGESYADSDIASWGSILRVTSGSALDGLIDESAMEAERIIRLAAFDPTQITSTEAFAALALSIQLNATADGYDSLQFSNYGVVQDGEIHQDITLNLTADAHGDKILRFGGTGLTGLLRDDGTQIYEGVFDGNNCTIEVNMGETYGVFENAETCPYSRGQIYQHSFLGFFAKIKNSTIQNLTVQGDADFALVGYSPAIYCGGIAAYAEATNSINHVTSNMNITYLDLPSAFDSTNAVPNGVMGGFIGWADKGINLTFTSCEWDSTITALTQAKSIFLSGYVARVDGNGDITVNDSTICGTIDECRSIDKYSKATITKMDGAVGQVDCGRVGGVIASLGMQVTGAANDKSTLSTETSHVRINNVTAHEANIKYYFKNDTLTLLSVGGFLGHTWVNTDVVIDGMTVEGCSIAPGISTSEMPTIGGLVHTASGHWQIVNDGVQFKKSNENPNIFKGQSYDRISSGLLICRGDDKYAALTVNSDSNWASSDYALYLEVGYDTYHVEEGSVSAIMTTNPTYFDDLVGVTISPNTGKHSGVISIETAPDTIGTNGYKEINQNGEDTWVTKSGSSFVNPNSRYYYNLGSLEKIENKNGGINFLMWSVRQLTEQNLDRYFTYEDLNATTIDLTGLSYYPVNVYTNVNGKTFIFDAQSIDSHMSDKTRIGIGESKSQHHGMQSGIFLNATGNYQISNLTLQGTISPVETKTGYNSTVDCVEGSGAIYVNEIAGTSTAVRTITFSGISLDGIQVINRENYAPLLVNRIGSYSTINISGAGVFTTAEYSKNGSTYQAATSLLGKVGNKSNASNIHLNILGTVCLDARSTAGDYSELYKTYNSIFTHATLLECFEYPASVTTCDGQYIFNKEDVCTYGYEIANSEENGGRNPDNQLWYYDTIGVEEVTDSLTGVHGYGFKTGYLRYVYIPENSAQATFEIDVNQRVSNLDEGCGTYGDPFIIKTGEQLQALAAYLDGTVREGFVLCLNPSVLANSNGTKDLHVREKGQRYTNDQYYLYTGGQWCIANKEEDGSYSKVSATSDGAKIQHYMRNAYYLIEPETAANGTYQITLSSSFLGIGAANNTTNMFSGVIAGAQNEAGKYPTLKVTAKSKADAGFSQFGGVVKYAQGCVVKDLIVDYTDARIIMADNAVANVTTAVDTQVYFGGVIGYVAGGDNLIDNVKVIYADHSVQTVGTEDCKLVDIGGYVGLVGGADTAGGGVIFRNFKNDYAGLVKIDGENLDADSYYWNPYVGRVLDGFACYDSAQSEADRRSSAIVYLDNTDKNYTIPNLKEEATKLDADVFTVNKNTPISITVSTAQQLWLLSAIVNSGAGAMDSGVFYKNSVYGYGYGRIRSQKYNYIGKRTSDLQNEAPIDETWWGGIASTSAENGAQKIPYLIRNYTSTEQSLTVSKVVYQVYPACRITGANSVCSLNFIGDLDMSPYGNGFRGIGASYQNYTDTVTNAQRRQIDCKNVQGIDSVVSVQLQRNIKEYNLNEKWHVYTAGFFNAFYNSTAATIQNIAISGNVILDADGYMVATVGEIGGFSGAILKGSAARTFENIRLGGDAADSLTLSGGSYVGGLFGYNKESGTDTVINSSYMHLNASGYNTAAGLVGNTARALTVENCTGESSIFTYTVANNAAGYGAGGFIGYCNGITIISGATISEISANGVNNGGLIARANSTLTLQDIHVTDYAGMGNSGIAGYAGGAIGYSVGQITMSDCDATQISIFMPCKGSYGGGIVGRADNANTTFDSVTASAMKLVVGGYVGGVLGWANNVVTIRNAMVDSSMCVVINDGYGAGGIVGGLNNTFKGHNLLSNDNLVGYLITTNNSGKTIIDTTATLLQGAEGAINFSVLNEDNVGIRTSNSNTAGTYYSYSQYIANTALATHETGSKIGIWVGNSNGKAVYLTAVSRSGPYTAVNNFGGTMAASSYVIYSDYLNQASDKIASEENRIESVDINSPYVESTPELQFPLSDGSELIAVNEGVGIVTKSGKRITKTSMQQIVADIAIDYTKKYSETYLYGYKAYPSMFTNGSWMYKENLSTYYAEEADTEFYEALTLPNDFPVYVIDNPTTVDEQIRSYIALATNSNYKNYSVEAKTYKWDGSVWEEQPNANLIYRDNKWYVRLNSYDNGNGEFTMVYVNYDCPATSGTYQIAIPMFVKKILQFDFYASILPGTIYAENPYDSNSAATIVGYGDIFTAKLNYVFKRSEAEWLNLINSGENINVALDNKAVWLGDTALPRGTEIILVDPYQNGRTSFYGKIGENGFALGSGGKLSFSQFNQYEDMYLCDMLNPKAVTTGKLLFVEDASGGHKDATIRCYANGDYAYYRLAGVGETATHRIEIHPDVDGYGFINQNYYLTVKTPSIDDVATPMINNLITFKDHKLDNGNGISTQKANPTYGGIYYYTKSGADKSENRYFINNFFDQSLTVYSNDNAILQIVDGQPDTRIDIEIENEISLNAVEQFRGFTTSSSTLYHSFTLSATEIEGDNTGKDIYLCAGTKYRLEYQVKGKNGETLTPIGNYTKEGIVAADTGALVFETANGDSIISWFRHLRDEDAQYDSVVITGTLTLAYDEPTLYTQFNVKSSSYQGVKFNVASKLSMQKNTLPITTMRVVKAPTQYFSREAFELATLKFYAYEYRYGERSGDVSHLGINAFKQDDVNELMANPAPIYACGLYDVSSLDAKDTNGAEKVKCNLYLYRKLEDGTYDLNSPLPINSYLDNVTIRGLDADYDSTNKCFKVMSNLTAEELESYQNIPLDIEVYVEVKSADKLPDGGFYANYKLLLTADLADGSGRLLEMDASDYIIYTNAKIDPRMQ